MYQTIILYTFTFLPAPLCHNEVFDISNAILCYSEECYLIGRTYKRIFNSLLTFSTVTVVRKCQTASINTLTTFAYF